jgi:hypothetical protein
MDTYIKRYRRIYTFQDNSTVKTIFYVLYCMWTVYRTTYSTYTYVLLTVSVIFFQNVHLAVKYVINLIPDVPGYQYSTWYIQKFLNTLYGMYDVLVPQDVLAHYQYIVVQYNRNKEREKSIKRKLQQGPKKEGRAILKHDASLSVPAQYCTGTRSSSTSSSTFSAVAL